MGDCHSCKTDCFFAGDSDLKPECRWYTTQNKLKRATEWRGEHAAVVNNHINYIDRLAEYEDTGLEPEEVDAYNRTLLDMGITLGRFGELVNADKEDRLVVLPCKVGDTIYKLCPVSAFLKKGDLWSGRIVERDCDMCAWGCCDCHDVGPHYDARHKNIVHEMKLGSLSSIVRIIPYWEKFYFSTREEAEQALQKAE